VFVTAGTGGVNLSDAGMDDEELPYFASFFAADPSTAGYGYVDLVADADQLTGRFVPVTGTHRDTFTIVRDPGAGIPPGEAFAIDSFSRSVTSGWGSAEAGGTWSVAPVAQGSITNGRGQLRMPGAGAGPGAYLTGPTSSSTDLTATMSVDKTATGSGTYVWLRGRRVPGAGDYRAKLWWRTGNALRLSLSRGDAVGAETAIGSSAMLSGGVTVGEQLRVRMQVTGTSPTTLRAKVWRLGQSEPAGWSVSATDGTAALQAAGQVGVTTYLSGSATNAPVVVSVDDWRAETP